MHTILGAGGPIANALQQELEASNENVRLVSRRQIVTTGDTTWQQADLMNYSETLAAAKNSNVIYLCAGLMYDHQIWRQQWPVIMQNVINVAKETQARLVFFDNVYMYGLVSGPMLETTPYNPCSRKGEVRAKIAEQLMAEAHSGNITACIARAPDYYGAGNMNSWIDMMVFSKFAKKQSAQWIGKPETLHSFILVNDAARAVALLGKNEESKNQVWHLPTSPCLTGTGFINIAAKSFDTKPRHMRINKLMLQTLGLFNKLIRETVEMYYQYEFDYQFNSDKFKRAFNVEPTPYQKGFQDVSAAYVKN